MSSVNYIFVVRSVVVWNHFCENTFSIRCDDSQCCVIDVLASRICAYQLSYAVFIDCRMNIRTLHVFLNFSSIINITAEFVIFRLLESEILLGYLVDFDMKYGHRRDVKGYADAVMEMDCFLNDFASKLNEDDLLIVTADHGCDPAHIGTDHTREYVPVLLYSKGIESTDLGVLDGFDCLGATVADLLGINNKFNGSFAERIRK